MQTMQPRIQKTTAKRMIDEVTVDFGKTLLIRSFFAAKRCFAE
jgi:hypothetical protein